MATPNRSGSAAPRLRPVEGLSLIDRHGLVEEASAPFIKSDEARRIARDASFRIEGILMMLRRDLTRDGLEAEDMAYEILVSHAIRLNGAVMSVLCEDHAVSAERLAKAAGAEDVLIAVPGAAGGVSHG